MSMSTSRKLEQTNFTSAFSRKRKNDSFVTDAVEFDRNSAHASSITGMNAVDEACSYKVRTFRDEMFGIDVKPVSNLCKADNSPYTNSNASTRELGEPERECKQAANDSQEQSTDSGAGKHGDETPNEKQDDNDNDCGSSCKGNYLPSARICLVCGDRASGYNFNVLSCESCKAFFRRNALKPSVNTCLFTGNCKIEMHTRRFCTACRLDKCLQVGMKRSMILNDDAKEKRRATMLENRERRTKGGPKQLSSASSSPKPNSDSNFDQTAQSIATTDDVKVPNVPPTPQIPVEAVKTNSEPLNCAPSATRPMLIRVASVDLNSSFVCVVRPDNSVPLPDCEEALLTEKEALDKIANRRILTEEEWRFLSILCDHYKEAFVSTAHSNDLPHPNTTLNALVNLTGLMVRKIIRFAKRVTEFQALRQPAQIALLKGSVVDTLYLHSAFHYDPNDECWYTPHGRVRTDILKQALAHESLPPQLALSRTIYEEHCLFARSLRPLLDDDWNIVTLLQLITLFSSHRPAIAHSYFARAEPATASSQPQSESQGVLLGSQDQTQIANIQDKFLVLLKHYLESKYSVVHARTLLVRIMQKIDELHQLTETHGRVLLFADPNQIEPLMLEVFDWLVAR